MKLNKLLVSSVASLLALTAVGIGTTFALFTTGDTAGAVIRAGKIGVSLSLSELKTYSGVDITGEPGVDVLAETSVAGTFTNNGHAVIDGNNLILDGITPGDKATFNLIIKNQSNINIKYRTIVSIPDDDGLLEGLKITVGGTAFNGFTNVSAWASYEGSDTETTIATVPVTIELPTDRRNIFAEKTCSIAFNLEAVQGNAHTTDYDSNSIHIFNATDLKLIANQINANQINNKTITLEESIDLAGITWNPIDASGHGIVFNGNDNSIYDMYISGGKNVGFFSSGNGLVVKNLSFFDSIIEDAVGTAGTIIGNGLCAKIQNCNVFNSSVTAIVTDDADGDRVGGIAGYLSGDPEGWVKDCYLENITVKGYRDVGCAVGYADGTAVIDGIEVYCGELINDRSNNYAHYTEDEDYDVNEIVGEAGDDVTVDNVTFEEVNKTIE